MDEINKKHLIDELNNLETAQYVSEIREDCWYYAGMQKGIIETLQELGYKVVQKRIQIHGDDVIKFLDIESEVK